MQPQDLKRFKRYRVRWFEHLSFIPQDREKVRAGLAILFARMSVIPANHNRAHVFLITEAKAKEIADLTTTATINQPPGTMGHLGIRHPPRRPSEGAMRFVSEIQVAQTFRLKNVKPGHHRVPKRQLPPNQAAVRDGAAPAEGQAVALQGNFFALHRFSVASI